MSEIWSDTIVNEMSKNMKTAYRISKMHEKNIAKIPWEDLFGHCLILIRDAIDIYSGKAKRFPVFLERYLEEKLLLFIRKTETERRKDMKLHGFSCGSCANSQGSICKIDGAKIDPMCACEKNYKRDYNMCVCKVKED